MHKSVAANQGPQGGRYPLQCITDLPQGVDDYGVAGVPCVLLGSHPQRAVEAVKYLKAQMSKVSINVDIMSIDSEKSCT